METLRNRNVTVWRAGSATCFFSIVAFMAICGMETAAFGQTTYTWTDADWQTAGAQLWSDASNWNPNGVPGQICTSCSVSVPNVSITGQTTFPIQDVSLTLQNLTIGNQQKVAIQSGNSLTLTGNTLHGYVQMVYGGGLGLTAININGGLTFTGTNSLEGIAMENNSQINGNGTLTNNGTISYGSVAGSPAGLIGANEALTLINNGLISSGGSASDLNLCVNLNWQNAGTLQATSGGTLNITCVGKITQSSSGQISASGSTVVLEGSGVGHLTISGGTLTSPNGGHLDGCDVISTA